MASCRRVLFLVTLDKGSMSLPYEQFNQRNGQTMKIEKYTHIKKKRKETVINYHLLCTCAGVR